MSACITICLHERISITVSVAEYGLLHITEFQISCTVGLQRGPFHYYTMLC